MKKYLVFILVVTGTGLIAWSSMVMGTALGTFLYLNQSTYQEIGATTARTTITNPWTFTATTTLGKSVVLTSSNTASSTIVATCYQFYATSTATAQKFQASTTPGIMYSQFGTCPNL